MINQEVAIRQMTVSELRQLATDFAKSGYFQDAREAAQAVVKIQAGLEMGFGPVYSMTKIYIVKGKVMVSAEALAAKVKGSARYDYKVVKLTDTECELQFTDRGEPAYLSRFSMDDAKRAGLLKEGGGWYSWPRAMLFSKALSQGARIVCPHVIAGVYTLEDFGIEANPDTGEVIESTATEVLEQASTHESAGSVSGAKESISEKQATPTGAVTTTKQLLARVVEAKGFKTTKQARDYLTGTHHILDARIDSDAANVWEEVKVLEGWTN